jgi:hypothetical protein
MSALSHSERSSPSSANSEFSSSSERCSSESELKASSFLLVFECGEFPWSSSDLSSENELTGVTSRISFALGLSERGFGSDEGSYPPLLLSLSLFRSAMVVLEMRSAAAAFLCRVSPPKKMNFEPMRTRSTKTNTCTGSASPPMFSLRRSATNKTATR